MCYSALYSDTNLAGNILRDYFTEFQIGQDYSYSVSKDLLLFAFSPFWK